MKCENCGTDFMEGIFCPVCGTRARIESDSKKKKEQKIGKEQRKIEQKYLKKDNKSSFCTQCGSQLSEGAIFCSNCGNRVGSENSHIKKMAN